MKPDPMIRRMGFIRDQEGIMNRYIRERSSWDIHLENTKKFILDSFQGNHGKVLAVLGSGWLLDVPLEKLSGRFDRVLLVDIHHPVQIRKKVIQYPNVELICADLSGSAIQQVWEITHQSGNMKCSTPLNELKLTYPIGDLNPDLFVSVNLLNQLDILLCDYLMKSDYFQQEELNRFRKRIQQFHLEWITQKPGCLISDIREHNRDHNGKETSKSLLYTDLPKGIRFLNWNWKFDTHQTYHPGMKTWMEVQAVEWK